MAKKPSNPSDSDLPGSIGQPATDALREYISVTRLEQLTQYTEKEILNLHGVGPKAIRLLKAELEARGLSFAPAKEKQSSKVKQPAKSSASDLPKLAQPAVRALTGAGITRLEQLTKMNETELKNLHGIGPNALKQLISAMQERGLSFADEVQKT